MVPTPLILFGKNTPCSLRDSFSTADSDQSAAVTKSKIKESHNGIDFRELPVTLGTSFLPRILHARFVNPSCAVDDTCLYSKIEDEWRKHLLHSSYISANFPTVNGSTKFGKWPFV